jgi:hypothetical protein
MPIVDDYAGIAAELRRLYAKKLPASDSVDTPHEPAQHRMRSTIAGELLYRRLVSQRMGRTDRNLFVGKGPWSKIGSDGIIRPVNLALDLNV